MKVRITLEADLSADAMKRYPPDAFGRQNLWDHIRKLYISDLRNASKLCADHTTEPEMLAYLVRANEIDIEIGKQFDETFDVVFIDDAGLEVK